MNKNGEHIGPSLFEEDLLAFATQNAAMAIKSRTYDVQLDGRWCKSSQHLPATKSNPGVKARPLAAKLLREKDLSRTIRLLRHKKETGENYGSDEKALWSSCSESSSRTSGSKKLEHLEGDQLLSLKSKDIMLLKVPDQQSRVDAAETQELQSSAPVESN